MAAKKPAAGSVADQLSAAKPARQTTKEWFVANGYPPEMFSSIPKTLKKRFAAANKALAHEVEGLDKKIEEAKAKYDRLVAARDGRAAAEKDRELCIKGFDDFKGTWLRF